MPFEPRQPGSDHSEENLPGELFALGEQLRDDALHLSEKYPAPLSGNNHPLLEATQDKVQLIAERHSERRIGRSIPKFAGSLIGLSLVVLLFGFSWTAYHRSVPNRRSTKKIEAEGNQIDSMPAVFLRDYSVPEMEGLFDLWEQEPPARARLSI